MTGKADFGTILKGALFLSGLIIGVGFFGLPYTAKEAGFFVAAGFLALAAILVSLIHLAFGEIALRTQGEHGLVGYARMYLGEWGKRLALLSGLGGSSGILLAYLIVGGAFLEIIFPVFSEVQWAAILSLVGFFLIFGGLRFSSRIEVAVTTLLVVALFAIIAVSFRHFNIKNFSIAGSPGAFFLPYGVALFSLMGAPAVPDLVKLFYGKEKFIHSAIILGTLIPALLYFFFLIAVLGASGQATTPEAIKGLVGIVGPGIVFFGAFIGLFAVFTSYIVLGLYVKRVFVFDLGLKAFLASLLAAGFPFLLYLIGLRSFISTISLVGAVAIGTDAVLIFLTHRQAQKKGELTPPFTLSFRKWFLYFLVLLFAAGAVVEMLKVFQRY